MNAGRINPAGNTISVSHDRCTKACSSDKRQLWWALSEIPQKYWGETFANPSPRSRPWGSTTGSYLEKPRDESGETRKSPPLLAPHSRDFPPEPKFSGSLSERRWLKTVSRHKLWFKVRGVEGMNTVRHLGREDYVTYFWFARRRMSDREQMPLVLCRIQYQAHTHTCTINILAHLASISPPSTSN